VSVAVDARTHPKEAVAAMAGRVDPNAVATLVAHQQQQAQAPVNPQLRATLNAFWANQGQEMQRVNDFKNHNLPLARIKKIMKSDEDVRMISSEAPALFAKACEMFILEVRVVSPRSSRTARPVTAGGPHPV
jgi:hypothetical protein